MPAEGPEAAQAQMTAQMNELQNLVRFYEKKIQVGGWKRGPVM